MRTKRTEPVASIKQLSFDMFESFWSNDSIIENPKIELAKEWSFNLFSLENIREQMPVLQPLQAEDVLHCEKRFYQDEGKGMLFTHGTGVGKTFVGLGIAKRSVSMGKGHIIIIAPTDKKCKDWIEEAEEHFDMKIYQLNDINDAKHGVCVTTYANYYQNEAISKIHWHLVIYDESHYLQQNGQGKQTVYEEMHKRIARLPSVKKAELRENRDFMATKTEDELNKIIYDYVSSTKVLFLSATPFAYVKSLNLADGCLWTIHETMDIKDEFRNYGYNQPNSYETFMIENFGYRMRHGKLTIPEGAVDLNLMERNFHEKYKKEGVIVGRQIEVDFDYSRDFIHLDSTIGRKIDDGMEIFDTDYFQKNYKLLNEYLDKKYNSMYKRQLFEAIKSRMVIPRIRKHVEMGRKVVVFHDFNNANPSHPFRFKLSEFISEDNENYWRVSNELQRQIDMFHEEYKEFSEMDLSELHNPIDSIIEAFGKDKVAVYNGTVSKGKRLKIYREFMSDDSEVNVFLGQRKACKEGVSLHDMTGVKPRVFVDLGLPTSPTDAIQGEGRIYRVGLKSNAMYEYQTIQTNLERTTFADIIAVRSRTAENLALGNLARNMELVFKEGYSGADYIEPHEITGVGGKSADRNFNEISEFEKSKTYYWANQKKTSKNKSSEGSDYYATPEPLGFKIVEWLNLNPGNRILEPSAGHGAIGRFFPDDCLNYFVEPSFELMSKLKINCSGNFIQTQFENYSYMNKFHKIAMNPPFGTNSKDAYIHLQKALRSHLYAYDPHARLIAIVPNSLAMNKYVQKIFEEDNHIRSNFFCSYEITLPACTFKRAGTSIYCKILIFDGIDRAVKNPVIMPPRNIDFTHIELIDEFFNEIEHLKL